MSSKRLDADVGLPKASSPVRIGHMFAGRYQIRKLLGRGGMGAVYLAHDLDVDSQVAIKVLDAEFAEVATAVQRFRQEVRLARQITHLNVTRTFDLGKHNGVHFLTMEYIEGRNLQETLCGKRMDASQMVAVVLQVCAGMQAAHRAGVIHRDLKPENLLIENGTGRIAITDFGIARRLGSESPMKTVGSIGTPAFMSPEQLIGQEVDAKTDVYSLGLIMYQLSTGTLPFIKDSLLSTAMARLSEQPADPRTIVENLPEHLADLTMHCLQREPTDRPDMAEVSKCLEGTEAVTFLPLMPAPYVSLPEEGRRIGLVLFRYRGESEQEFLAEALTEDLIDIFSMTGGISVVQATDGMAAKDAVALGTSLQVSALVSGSVQVANNKIRVSARLTSCEDGLQLWSAQFEGSLKNILELQEQLANQIAEALRIELVVEHRGTLQPQLIEDYLRARQLASRGQFFEPREVVALLERCLEESPTFKPALVALARGYTNLWFIGDGSDSQSKAQQAVSQVLEVAPELAESHLAAGVYAANGGDLASAARFLAQALKIAPTFAEAHHYLGQLQLEAGRPEEGIGRLEFANRLSPTSATTYLSLAREYALQGDFDQYESHLAKHDRVQRTNTTGRVGITMRIALWQRDLPGVRRELGRTHGVEAAGYRLLRDLGAGAIDELTPNEYHASLQGLLRVGMSPRMKALVSQVGCEGLCFRRRGDLGLDLLKRATALVDLSWIDRCPIIDVLRDDAGFVAIRAQVAQRVGAIWDFAG